MPEALPIAVQLYSVRNELEKDLEGTIERLAAKGFLAVEGFGYEFEKVAAACKHHGLKVCSTHGPAPVGENRAKSKAMVQAFDTGRLLVPWLPAERFASASSVQEVVDMLRESADAAAEDGYELGYHNHDFEFQPVEGSTGYHYLLDRLDPRVFIELDTYWAQVAGQDLVELVQHLGTRLKLLHIKDGQVNPAKPMTAVGDGVIAWAPVFEAATSAEWAIVELDESATDMMEAVEKSYDYLIGAGLAYGNL